MLTSAARTSLGLALAALLALLIAGCGGDDDGGSDAAPSASASAEESQYYQRLADALASTAGDMSDLAQQRTEAFEASQAQAEREEASVALAESYVAVMAQRLADITAVVPPESLVELHQALIGAARENVDLGDDLVDRLTETPVATDAEYNEVLVSLEASTVNQRFRDACSDMQNRAVGAGSDVDLGCTDS